jgi:hypothetical protein
MNAIEPSIDVEVPVPAASGRSMRFEGFLHFMQAMDRIDQVTATRTRRRTTVGGVTCGFGADTGARRGEVGQDRPPGPLRTGRRGAHISGLRDGWPFVRRPIR